MKWPTTGNEHLSSQKFRLNLHIIQASQGLQLLTLYPPTARIFHKRGRKDEETTCSKQEWGAWDIFPHNQILCTKHHWAPSRERQQYTFVYGLCLTRAEQKWRCEDTRRCLPIAWSHKPPSDVLSPVIQFNILSENTQVPELESPASMVTTLPHVLYLKVQHCHPCI